MHMINTISVICAQCRCINIAEIVFFSLLRYLWNQHFYIINVRRHFDWNTGFCAIEMRREKEEKNTCALRTHKQHWCLATHIRISLSTTITILLDLLYTCIWFESSTNVCSTSAIILLLRKIFTWKSRKMFARFNFTIHKIKLSSSNINRSSSSRIIMNELRRKSQQLYCHRLRFLHSLKFRIFLSVFPPCLKQRSIRRKKTVNQI